MRKLPFFLLLSALGLAPLHVSAMMEGKKEEHKKSGYSKETLERNSDEQLLQAQEKAAEKINNPVADNNTETEFKVFVEKEEMVEESTLKQAPDVNAMRSLPSDDANEESEKEDLSDLGTLEQRLQEALEVISGLTGKGPAIEQKKLAALFEKWSKRYERYQEAQSSLLERNSNAELIEQQQNESRLQKLGELVEASKGTVETLQQKLEELARPEITRSFDSSDLEHPSEKPRWEEEINKQNFSTEHDGALLWTGYYEGNKSRAKEYARFKNKQTLEMTPGGEWLEERDLYKPDFLYDQSDADALWKYVSEKFVRGASGHVIAFISETRDLNSIYHKIEKPFLKNKEDVFLSQKIFKQDSLEPFSQEEQQLLKANRKHLEKLLTILQPAEEAWNSIAAASDFTRDNQLQFHLAIKKIAWKYRENFQTLEKKLKTTLLHDYLKEAHEVIKNWEALHNVIGYFYLGEIENAQVAHQKNQKGIVPIYRLVKLDGWGNHCDLLNEAIQTVDYSIFKAYRDAKKNSKAAQWKQECIEQDDRHFQDAVQPNHATHSANNTTGEKILQMLYPEHLFIRQTERPAYSLTYSSFWDWHLPFIKEQGETKPDSISPAEEKREESLPPQQPEKLQRELEKQGRAYLFEAQEEIEQQFLPVDKKTPSSYQRLLDWTRQQVADPKLAQKQQVRWEKRREVQRLRQECDRLARIIMDEADPWQNEEGSVVSALTGNQKIAKAPSIISALSFRSRGIQKQTVAENEPVKKIEDLQQEFLKTFEQEKKATAEWLSLAKQEGVALGISFVTEESAIKAWAAADDLALEEEVLKTYEDPEVMKKHWSEFMGRIEACTLAELPLTELIKLEKEKHTLAKNKTLSELEGIRQAALEKELEQKWTAVQAWREKAETSHSLGLLQLPEKSLERALVQLAANDLSVVKRWQQFEKEKDANHEAVEQRLQPYSETLCEILGQKSAITQDVKKYNDIAREEALRAVQEKIPGAHEAWEARTEESQKQLKNLETKLESSEISAKEKAALRDNRTQLEALFKSDKEAFHLFKKEKRRLDRIEKIWKNIEKGTEEKTFKKALKEWEELSLKEQEQYNKKADDENQRYQQDLKKEEGFLERSAKKLKEEENKAQQSTLDFLKQARSYYDERLQKLKERQEMLRWGKMEAEERMRFISSQKSERCLKKADEVKLQAATAREAQAEALRANDYAIAAIQEEIAEVLGGAAYYYSDAAWQEKNGTPKAAELYTQAGKACEAQVEALRANDHATAAIQKKILLRLGSAWLEGASYYYDRAAEAEKKREQEYAAHYRRQGEAKEKKAKALQEHLEAVVRGDEKATNLHKLIVAVSTGENKNKDALDAYINAAQEQAQKNEKVAELYIQMGRAWVQAEALKFEDILTTEFKKRITNILVEEEGGSVIYYYNQAIEAEERGYRKSAELYSQAAKTREAQVKALRAQAVALKFGEEHAAALQAKIAWVLDYYSADNSSAALKEGERAAIGVNHYLQAGKACEAQIRVFKAQAVALKEQIQALNRGDKITAAIQEKIAEALGGEYSAAFCYRKAAEKARSSHSYRVDYAASFYFKIGKAHEAQAEALKARAEAFNRRDKTTAAIQEKIAEALGEGTYYSSQAAEKKIEISKKYDKYDWLEREEPYEREAKALQNHLEAVLRGDEKAKEIHQLIRIALEPKNKNAVDAYIEAAREQSRGNEKVAKLYIETGRAWEAQAEALKLGCKATAEIQKKIAVALGGKYGAAYCCSSYNQKEGESYEKEAKTLQEHLEAVVRGDEKAKTIHELIETALEAKNENAVNAYIEAAKEQSQGNEKVAEFYIQTGRAWEVQAEALKREDIPTAELQEKIAEALGGAHGAAFCYKRAVEAEKKEHSKVVEVCLQAAKICEAQVESLKRGNKAVAAVQKEIVSVLVEGWKNVADCYTNAAEEDKNGNQAVAASDRRDGESGENQARVFQNHLNAVLQGEEKAKKIHEVINAELEAKNKDDRDPLFFCIKAINAQSQGNEKASELYLHAGKIRARANALVQVGEVVEKVQKIATALAGSYCAPYCYRQAADAQLEGNEKVVELYIQAAKAREAQAEAFDQGDEAAAEVQKRIAEILGSSPNANNAASCYKHNTSAFYSSYNQKEGESYEREAKTLQEHLEAVLRGDEKAKKIHQLIRTALEAKNKNAMDAYIEAAKEQSQGKEKVAELYIERGRVWEAEAEAREAEAEALKQGDEVTAKVQESIALVLGTECGAASYYSQAAEAEKEGGKQVAESYLQAAKAREAQVIALKQGDKVTAEVQMSIAWALGGKKYYSSGSAADYYAKAVEAEREGSQRSAKLYTQAAVAREAQVKALKKGESAIAEVQRKIAMALGGFFDDGAANYYSKAEYAEKNAKHAQLYIQAGEAREAQVAALVKDDNAVAWIQEKIAKTLGSAAYCYSEAAKEEKNGNQKEAQKFLKAGEEKEAALAQLRKELEALMNNK
ncbi:MAG: hypothetical protein K2W99_08160 [Chthoniobacterales bacterium]|nr:hypothetical protein [Chthoniobacterales bacterium]